MEPLQSEILANDPRVAEAKKLLHAALSDRKKNLKSQRPPQSDRKVPYEAALNRLREIRGNALYYPYLGSGFGNGPLVELADGSVKYDFISGIGVHFFGHNAPEFLSMGVDASLQNTVMQGHLQQNRDSVELLELMLLGANRRGRKFVHGILTSSGAMANENALKIVLQHKSPASRVLAFSHCFAGRTLATSQITDKPAYRQGLPSTLTVDYVPFYNPDQPVESTNAAVVALQSHLDAHPGQHAAMFFELIQGEGGGYVPGSPDFFRILMQTARARGVKIVADEIQTLGRTEDFFAFQYFGLSDLVDVITFGKMAQACGTLYIAELNPKPGLISQTYTTSTTAIRAGIVVIKALLENDFLGPTGKIATLSGQLREGLIQIAKRHTEWVCGPYGLGAMVAFTPFDGSVKKVAALCQTLFDQGLIAFVAGAEPTRVRFLPPMGGMNASHIEAVLKILDQALVQCANAH